MTIALWNTIERTLLNHQFGAQSMKSTTLAGDALLSIATIPLLAGVLTAKAIGSMMEGIGNVSEDIFRGDRLPVLKTPPTAQSSVDADNLTS